MQIPIKDILAMLENAKFIGNKEDSITFIGPLDIENEDSHNLMRVNEANLALLHKIKFVTIICNEGFEAFKDTCNYIIVEKPRSAFKQIIEHYFQPKFIPEICSTAQIHHTAQIGANVYIGHHVVIEENCLVGNNSAIGHNTVLLKNTTIGNDVKIGANCTIGGVGFGYEKDIDGNYSLIPHIGNVLIKDKVEIGNNVCVDRAVMGSTVIGENVKIDNLVHIAHGVKIGRNSLIISNATIAGSSIIGENVWFAPSATAMNKIVIGNNATIGIGSVVIKTVGEGETVFGNPGRVTSRSF